jgi:hypothetical protein
MTPNADRGRHWHEDALPDHEHDDLDENVHYDGHWHWHEADNTESKSTPGGKGLG